MQFIRHADTSVQQNTLLSGLQHVHDSDYLYVVKVVCSIVAPLQAEACRDRTRRGSRAGAQNGTERH